MKTEIKRSDYPDTPEGQHSYEMKVYSEEMASKDNDAMLEKFNNFFKSRTIKSFELKKDKK